MSQGRILAASDIHGYGHLLKQLLASAAYDSAVDRLFLLGDYVNKGPDSLGTLELIHSLVQQGAIALQGNNERAWLRSRDAEAMLWHPWIHTLPGWAEADGFLFVHAGIHPGVPMESQSIEDLTSTREPAFYQHVLPGKTIVFGHTPTFRLGNHEGGVWLGPGKLGIDTGVGHGRRLSLIDLTHWTVYSTAVREELPEVQVVSIQSGLPASLVSARAATPRS